MKKFYDFQILSLHTYLYRKNRNITLKIRKKRKNLKELYSGPANLHKYHTIFRPGQD